MTQFNWIDYVILAIVALSVLTGLFRGFVKELVALIIWVLAIWLAYQYADKLDPWLAPYLKDESIRKGVAFAAVIIGTLIAGGLVNATLGFILKHTGLSGTDRLLGMGFGLVRGVFFVALIMLGVQMTSMPYQQYAEHSWLYAKFDPLVNWLSRFTPQLAEQAKLASGIESNQEDDTEESTPIDIT